jgi:uncharacterized protein YgiB involved in biofilm formation
MALTENEKRYWRGYFERKAAAKEEKENSEIIDALKQELTEVKKQLKKQYEEHCIVTEQSVRQERRGSGIMPFVAGCVLGLFIGG